MFVIENTASVVSTNLGDTPSRQALNGITIPDPAVWSAKRYELKTDGNPTEVLAGDCVYRYIVDNNAIPIQGGEQGATETLTELGRRITYRKMAVVSSGTSTSILSGQLEGLTLNVAGNPSFDGTLFPETEGSYRGAWLSGQITITDSNPFTWTGRFSGTEYSGHQHATLISGGGTAIQVWEFKDVFIRGDGTITIEIGADSFTPFNNTGTFSYKFAGSLVYSEPMADVLAFIFAQQNPIESDRPAITDDDRKFVGDIQWWALNRSKATESFFDTKPAVGIGRRGAVQVAITSPKPFDSVALVNCECLEAEVVLPHILCRVQGADTTPIDSSVGMVVSLTCIGNAPTSGTGLLDGVITLRSDTNFTWDGVAFSNSTTTPENLIATRMPNDGANDAMVQHWIVKGAVYNFRKTGIIIVNNAIGFTNATGEFEGVVSYTGNTTITETPDAPQEPSDLLFTGLAPVAVNGAYTATINVRADTSAIPTSTQAATGRPTASVGQIIVGRSKKIGYGLDSDTQPEMVDGDAFDKHLQTNANSFTRKQIDGSRIDREIGELGVSGNDSTNIVKRAAIYQVRATPNFPRNRMQNANRQLYKLRGGEPAIFFINADTKFGTMVYGILKESSAYFTKGTDDGAHASMIIESLI